MKYDTAYVTKYWATQGIIEAPITDRCLTTCPDGRMICISPPFYFVGHYIHKPWWYETRAEAETHVRVQRDKKIKAVKKQLAKLEAAAEKDCKIPIGGKTS